MKTKIIFIIFLTILLIIFVLQNTEIVIVNFWFWDLSIPRALLLFVCFAMGLIIGLIIPSSEKRIEQNEEQNEEQQKQEYLFKLKMLKKRKGVSLPPYSQHSHLDVLKRIYTEAMKEISIEKNSSSLRNFLITGFTLTEFANCVPVWK